MNGRCDRCFAQLQSTGGCCDHCGWPLYDIFRFGASTTWVPRLIPLSVTYTITGTTIPIPRDPNG